MLAYRERSAPVEPMDLARLVEDMGHLLASVSPSAPPRATTRRDLPPLQADATQLRQVVMNLIINALDAIGEQEGVID